jgi:dipeptidase D
MEKRMDEMIKIFKELTKIPHCSGQTEALKNYIEAFAQRCGYHVQYDQAGNIMAYAKESLITFQAHYDMVCIGKAPEIEIVINDGWMSAKESSLGADNGMGVAMMLYLMEKGAKADFLFTNDEEIGLIGADRLELSIKTPLMINLDSEELGKVYIGCAGGEDIFVHRTIDWIEVEERGEWFRIWAEAPGGHSGVNIADNIPNALIELAGVIVKNGAMEVASINGGERINAIPRRAEAVVWVPEGVTPCIEKPNVHIEPIEKPSNNRVMQEGRTFVRAIFGFAHGVRAWNRELDLPQSSINLAQVTTDEQLKVAFSARAMANEDLQTLVEQTIAHWEALGFTCRTEGKYPAWKPVVNQLSQKVLEHYRQIVPDASYAAIHAGLECALFADKFPQLQIVSMGPTILDPHSDRERVDLDSVAKVMEVVERILADESL